LVVRAPLRERVALVALVALRALVERLAAVADLRRARLAAGTITGGIDGSADGMIILLPARIGFGVIASATACIALAMAPVVFFTRVLLRISGPS
jgi:hypothetical protein